MCILVTYVCIIVAFVAKFLHAWVLNSKARTQFNLDLNKN
jgi:phosphopantothenoylcysteine synthetase/decarboxylase